MRQLLSIAKLTFLMPFRRRSAWALLTLLAVVAGFMFWVSRGDGILVNELKLRIRFAMYAATGLLSLILLWFACYSMRGDIDAKRMHLLTAYPLARVWIYLGKWLGLLGIAASGLITTMLVVSASAWILIRNWDNPEHRQQLVEDFGAIDREVRPYIPDAREMAREIIREIKLTGRYPSGHPESEEIERLRQHIIRNQQLVNRNQSRRWPLTLPTRAPEDGDLVFKYRFYAHEKEAVQGVWSLAVSDDGENFYNIAAKSISVRPSRTHSIRFPASVVRPNGKLIIEFQGVDNPDLLFYNHSGLRLYYRDTTWPVNILIFFLVMMAHFAVVIVVGLTLAVPFTLSVSSFVAAVIYLLARSGEFFQGFLRELQLHADAGVLQTIGGVIIRFGLFFTTGTEPPGAIYSLSEATRIAPDNLGMLVTRQAGSLFLSPVRVFTEDGFASLQALGLDLILGYALYFLIIAGLGIWLLTRKELDRVH